MDPSTIITKLENRQPFILGHEKFREYAVLLPLVKVNNETHILFEERSMNLRSQPGDICFPGGKVDKEDPTVQYTAIRETSEELGINKSNIKNVLPLDYIVSSAGRIVYPYVGEIINPERIRPNPEEVAETLTVPLSYFLQTVPREYIINVKLEPEKDFPFDLIVGGEDYEWQPRQKKELFYEYDNKVIWGLTATIISHLVNLLKSK